MKQLFYLMLLCTSIFTVSCNKEVSDNPKSASMETPKVSANSVSLSEAKVTFMKAEKEVQNSLTGSTPLNLADFDPQWSQANDINYVDTSGNALIVPTTVFQSGGYKKLSFFRINGQINFLVTTVVGTMEYLIRKNGICTMDDFCGYVYYTKPDGTPTGGYKLDNGVVVAFLIPKTGPRPEWTFLDQLLGEYTVTAPSSGGGGTIPIFINTGSFSNYKNLLNDFSIDLNNSGSGSSNNSSLNGSAPPPVNADLCASTFVVTDNVPNGTKDMGVRSVDLIVRMADGTFQTVGFSGLSVYIPRINSQTGQVVSDPAAAQIAATAINNAQNQLQAKIDAGTVSITQAGMKREFGRLASTNIDNASGIINPNPPGFRVTWELSSFIGGQLMAYRVAVTGCP